MIDFKRKRLSILNALTGEEYTLVALDLIDPSEERVAQLASICSEPLIYNWLFRELLSGKSYTTSNSRDWFAWGKNGWLQNTHFGFGVIDKRDGIAAACAIKSANIDGAEIGYWASSGHRGVMTNAVLGLIKLAKEAGFERLLAETHEENVRSQAVLSRAGFAPAEGPPRIMGHILFSIDTRTANQAQHSTAGG